MRNRRNRRAWLGIGLLVLALPLAACSDSDDSVSSGNKDKENSSSSGPGKESDYEGLTKKAAIAKADSRDTPWRITREDDEQFPVTLDYNPDRVSFEIDDGIVTKASFG